MDPGLQEKKVPAKKPSPASAHPQLSRSHHPPPLSPPSLYILCLSPYLPFLSLPSPGYITRLVLAWTHLGLVVYLGQPPTTLTSIPPSLRRLLLVAKATARRRHCPFDLEECARSSMTPVRLRCVLHTLTPISQIWNVGRYVTHTPKGRSRYCVCRRAVSSQISLCVCVCVVRVVVKTCPSE